jgi:nucleotide-binding universal stress UspA family protein
MQEPMASRSSGDADAARDIVVGIGQSGPSRYSAALAFAAQMSQQRQAGLRLVHGCLPRLSIALRDEALERHIARGEQLLEEAQVAVSTLVDQGVSVNLAALPQTAVEALLQESRTAEAVVVQRRGSSSVGRVFSGVTSDTVAAQGACPVVVVRHDQSQSGDKRGVVVGLGAHSGTRALDIGITEATARKCPLTAVYVWDLEFSPTFGSSIDPDGEELAEASKWADSVLANAVIEIAKTHPDVELHARSIRGVIEDGLLQESQNAELLVVERHRDAHLASIGLGTLTRHLLDHAPCPVMVTPHSDPHDHLPRTQATGLETTAQS